MDKLFLKDKKNNCFEISSDECKINFKIKENNLFYIDEFTEEEFIVFNTIIYFAPTMKLILDKVYEVCIRNKLFEISPNGHKLKEFIINVMKIPYISAIKSSFLFDKLINANILILSKDDYIYYEYTTKKNKYNEKVLELNKVIIGFKSFHSKQNIWMPSENNELININDDFNLIKSIYENFELVFTGYNENNLLYKNIFNEIEDCYLKFI